MLGPASNSPAGFMFSVTNSSTEVVSQPFWPKTSTLSITGPRAPTSDGLVVYIGSIWFSNASDPVPSTIDHSIKPSFWTVVPVTVNEPSQISKFGTTLTVGACVISMTISSLIGSEQGSIGSSVKRRVTVPSIMSCAPGVYTGSKILLFILPLKVPSPPMIVHSGLTPCR